MAVSREVYRAPRQQVVAIPNPTSIKQPVTYMVTVLLALLALYALMSNVVGWATIRLDDIRYGRPRTFHLAANVGHGEHNGIPTHFFALNLERQIIVLEIPGGDAAHIRTLQGPYLFGAGEDLTPVKLRAEDVNTDGAHDLVLQVKDEEVIYINRDGGFVLITPEEQQQVMMRRAGS